VLSVNTAIQRSTAPAGSISTGKEQIRKDLTKILVAHNIPYVAQTTPFHWKDLAMKVEKALAVDKCMKRKRKRKGTCHAIPLLRYISIP
jgi:hypothetical protein